MKKFFALLALITVALSGCKAMTNFTQGNAATDQHMTCDQLKRQIIFYRNDQNMNIQWNSPTKRATLMQRYTRMNCDTVLADSKINKASS
ncbi:MAG: hypothetical protein KAS93_05805 [Gammaproteobacteria bacterium]|nr:hypothetical protein [Gammaproteobacteria bacterium]